MVVAFGNGDRVSWADVQQRCNEAWDIAALLHDADLMWRPHFTEAIALGNKAAAKFPLNFTASWTAHDNAIAAPWPNAQDFYDSRNSPAMRNAINQQEAHLVCVMPLH